MADAEASRPPPRWPGRRCALTGSRPPIREQIDALEPFLAAHLAGPPFAPRPAIRSTSGPTAMVIYRDDCRFLLDDVIPRQGRANADYDLVIASQPYRARVPRRVQGRARSSRRWRARCGRAAGCSASIRAAAIRASRSSAACGPTRTRSRPTATTSCARRGRARPRCAPLQLQRLRRQRAGVPLRHAHAALGDRRRASAPRRCSRPGTPPSTSPRSTTSAWPRCSAPAYLDATREVLQAHGSLWFHESPT